MSSENVICPQCDGVGSIENTKGKEEACKYCKGRGFVPKEMGNDSEETI